MNSIIQLDINILNWIQENLSCGFLDFLTPKVTFLLEFGWFYIALAIIFLFFPKTRKTGLMLGATMLIGLILCNGILKNLFDRVRPYTEEIVNQYGSLKTAADLIIKVPFDSSWPSGHTTAAFEAAVLLMLRDKRWGIPAMVVAVFVAFSRMYQFVHYPTDIIGGIIIGTVSAILGYLIVGKIWDAVAAKRAKKN